MAVIEKCVRCKERKFVNYQKRCKRCAKIPESEKNDRL